MANPLLRQQRQAPVQPGHLNPNVDGDQVPVGLGPAPFEPSQPRGAPASRRIGLPGCNFPPPDAIQVNAIDDAVISEGTSATILTIVVPDTMSFRISHVGFGAGDESGLRFLSWSLFADPPVGTVPGFVDLPAALGSIVHPAPVFAVLGSSVTVTLVATNNSTLIQSYTYQAIVQGWFYSEKEAVPL